MSAAVTKKVVGPSHPNHGPETAQNQMHGQMHGPSHPDQLSSMNGRTEHPIHPIKSQKSVAEKRAALFKLARNTDLDPLSLGAEISPVSAPASFEIARAKTPDYLGDMAAADDFHYHDWVCKFSKPFGTKAQSDAQPKT